MLRGVPATRKTRLTSRSISGQVFTPGREQSKFGAAESSRPMLTGFGFDSIYPGLVLNNFNEGRV